MKDDEVKVPVYNLFLMKQIVEEDGKLLMIGTFIQHCYENSELEEKLDGRLDSDAKPNGLEFDYRFNDETAAEGSIAHRRTEKYEGTDMGTVFRHTYQVKVPLDVNVEFDFFPFRVVSAKVLVELSSITSSDNELRLRPNFYVHLADKTNMFTIQKDPMKAPKGTSFDQAQDRMDKTEAYDFVSPFPKISFLYDKKKRYCPKFLMKFTMVEDGMKKFVEIVAPMFLIAGMNTIHVLNPDEEVDTADYIANSATFALSVLVFLPTMVGTSRVQQLWTVNNLYIMFIFMALTLSSIPDTWAGHKRFAIAGMILYWVSFLFPIVNSLRYYMFIQKAKQKTSSSHFWSQKGKKPYKASNKTPSTEFASVEKVVLMSDAERKELEYKLKDLPGNDKTRLLEFASRAAVARNKERQQTKNSPNPETTTYGALPSPVASRSADMTGAVATSPPAATPGNGDKQTVMA